MKKNKYVFAAAILLCAMELICVQNSAFCDPVNSSNERIKNQDNDTTYAGGINRDFVDLSISDEKSSGAANGGAIYNFHFWVGDKSDAVIGDINGNFIRNHAYASKNDSIARAEGGAIYNENATIGNIAGDFIENYAKSDHSSATGGAIYESKGNIGNIIGNFIGNCVMGGTTDTSASGGAIYASDSTIGNIKGNFENNYGTISGGGVSGGAIVNSSSKIGDITGDFIGNHASAGKTAKGGAIYMYSGSTEEKIAKIGNIKGNFIGNYAESSSDIYGAEGGAIFNDTLGAKGSIASITGDFIGNHVNSAGGNALGGAIYNGYDSYIGEKDEEGNLIGGVINSDFYGNYAFTTKKEDYREAKGGAIYTKSDFNIIADNGSSTFSGNYIMEGENGEKKYQAVWVEGTSKHPATLNLISKNNGTITFDDEINGTNDYKINITGDMSSKVVLNNSVKGMPEITLKGTNLYLGKDDVLNNDSLNLSGGMLSMVNGSVGVSSLKSLTLSETTDFVADVDLQNETMDRFTASSYKGEANLNVVGMNLLSDTEKSDVEIFFAQKGLKDKVLNGIEGKLTSSGFQGKAFSPIYEYDVGYSNKNDGGYFTFHKEGFNPAVLASPVANQAGNMATMTETLKFAFEHADGFSKLPLHVKLGKINQDRYAISEDNTLPFENSEKDHVWFRPYTSFERMQFKNNSDTDAILYGALVGTDSNFNKLRGGFYNVHTFYMGYTGARLDYQNVDTNINGGVIGFTETFYKKNFFSALTLSLASNTAVSDTMYGRENYTSLLSGLGSKTGYNFEFKDGKYIIQPQWIMNYVFSNTFDYKNAANVKIKSDPYNSIQLNPQIRFIVNFENGWEPYLTAGFVWNVLNEGTISANDIILPKMSIKPYAQYGLGVQKVVKDKFAGYFQALVNSGGRTGVSLSCGIHIQLGKENKKAKENL